jgi:hypothetical protein
MLAREDPESVGSFHPSTIVDDEDWFVFLGSPDPRHPWDPPDSGCDF